MNGLGHHGLLLSVHQIELVSDDAELAEPTARGNR